MTPEPERDPRLPTVSPWAGKSAAEYAASVDQGIAEHNVVAKRAPYQVWSRGKDRHHIASADSREDAEVLARKHFGVVWSPNPRNGPMLVVGAWGREKGPWADLTRGPQKKVSKMQVLLLARCDRMVNAADGSTPKDLDIPRRWVHRIARYVSQGWAPWRKRRLDVSMKAVCVKLEKGRLVVRVTA